MIYVVRHGQTNWNKEGRIQGRSDYVVSSPQQRAIQTAEIASGAKATIDDRLNVFDLGEADGLHKSEVKMSGVIPDPTHYKGVEDREAFVERIFAFMDELKAAYSGSDANILISGHRCTTGCIAAYFEGLPEDGNILKASSSNGDYKTYSF